MMTVLCSVLCADYLCCSQGNLEFLWVLNLKITSIVVLVFFQHIANYISGIQTIGHRVIVSDVQESFIWVRYKRNENQLIIFADDTYPRWVTTASLLDYDTVAGADKFGNICVVS